MRRRNPNALRYWHANRLLYAEVQMPQPIGRYVDELGRVITVYPPAPALGLGATQLEEWDVSDIAVV